MKQITFTLLFLSSFCHQAQLFNGGAGPIQNNGVETYFNLAVTGLSPANIDSLHGLEEVCINITHPKVEELYIYLVSPSGTTVELTEGASCYGANYATCFNSNAGSPITSTLAPYSGTLRPIGYLGRFNTGQAGNGNWTLIVKDYLAFVNSGSLVSWSLKFTNTPSKPVILSATNLPIVIINTNNQIITDFKKTMDLGIIYNGVGQLNHPGDPKNNYNSKAAIHIRGNTTKNFEKKAFSVELRDINGMTVLAPLLGMPAESDWELIAEYQDKTLIRIPLTYQLSRQMGNYAARTKYVEVIIDGEYRGVYAFVEKIKRGLERVNIRKLATNDNALPFISGGYILKIDRPNSPGWSSLLPGLAPNGAHFFYQYYDPKDTVITPQQDSYIKGYMNNFETVMSSANYANPGSGYSQLVDVASCVDIFIVNEMSKNVDGYRLSSYLYKKDIAQGGKLFLGPAWDYDLAWHNCNYANTTDPTGWEYQSQDTSLPSPIWWSKFMQDTNFVNKVYCRWQSLRQTVLSNNNIYHYIDSSASVLSDAKNRNFKQWPIIGTYIFPNPQNQSTATYATEVADLKSWVSNRFAWLDGAIKGYCAKPIIGISENEQDENTVSVFPIPAENAVTFKLHLINNVDVALTVTDALGRNIMSYSPEKVNRGDSEFMLTRTQFPTAGLYFYQLIIDNRVKAGKLIIQ